jgi:tetratricopeptide (TPR) repeat protein
VFRVVATIAIFFSLASSAQEDARKLKLDGRKPIRLEYLAPGWNKDAQKVDVSAIVIRDSLSGRLAKVEMSETGSNTSQFTGTYQINFQAEENASSEFTPEVYLAPLAVIQADQQLVRVAILIKEGTLLRKPYFLRIERGNQTISVFDSRSQALEAYQTFLKSTSGKPLVDPAAFAAQRLAQKSLEETNRLEQAQASANARIVIEEDERKRQEQLRLREAQLSAEEKQSRKAKASGLAAEALTLFQQNDTKGAEEKFNQAIELDPENTSYAFQYGVTLYRNDKYNRAVVLLDLAKGENVNANERDYYKALSHMKLKEYEVGYKVFTDLKSRNDKTTSPLAAFYAGVIDFQNEKYDVAKSHFEYVLDNSSDPKIDEQADTFIEQIANVKRFQAMREKNLILGFNFGLMYDSNILSVSAANAPTDLAGYRWSYGGSVEYRPVFSEKHEFSGILTVSDMYSTDQSFKAKTEFQNTDPLIMNLSLPYKFKGEALGKPAQLGLTPAYETVQMNSDGTGSREGIVNSLIVKGDGTFVMRDDWFANYALEVRRDTSLLSGVSDDDIQTANKVTLSTTQTFFQDAKKTKAILGEGSFAMNMAEGKNQQYNRIDLAASYLMPAFAETTFLSRFGVGTSQYSAHTTGRTDTNFSLTLVLQKQITETWGANVMANFNKNNSTIETNAYDKYVLMAGVNWKNAF